MLESLVSILGRQVLSVALPFMPVVAMTMLRSTIFMFATHFLLSTMLCILGVPVLRNLKLGQTVRIEGPKTHYRKNGTPTFGGIFFLTPLLISSIIVALVRPLDMAYFSIVLLMTLFAAVGFLDDYTKVRKDKEGLSVKKKTIYLTITSFAFTVWYLYFARYEPFFIMPIIKKVLPIEGPWKIVYGIFTMLFIFFVSNAVNLTDGIDGLCASLNVISSLFMALICFFIAPLLGINYNMHALVWVSVAIAGAAAGFLMVNHYPAKVFMGDTGSLALGAGFAGITLLAGIPWIVALVGFIYCVEALSTLLQVWYFKRTGKRIFLMAPLHHHYEKEGWSEWKIVGVFSALSVVGAIAGILCVI